MNLILDIVKLEQVYFGLSIDAQIGSNSELIMHNRLIYGLLHCMCF